MHERSDWFNKDRKKQKLMAEVLEIAGQAVEKLKGSNFRYTDSHGEVRIKKEFSWSEFSPLSKNGKPLLRKIEVLQALGIGKTIGETSIEETPRSDLFPANRELKGIWPTFIPGLNYIRVRGLDINLEEYDYFQIDQTQDPATSFDETQGPTSPFRKTQNEKEKNADWNKRMWDQPDADKKANEEITKDMANYGPDRNK